jgi:hypothetical protein
MDLPHQQVLLIIANIILIVGIVCIGPIIHVFIIVIIIDVGPDIELFLTHIISVRHSANLLSVGIYGTTHYEQYHLTEEMAASIGCGNIGFPRPLNLL